MARLLDAHVIQQTIDGLLSLTGRRLFELRWTQTVIDEMRRDRPPELSEAMDGGAALWISSMTCWLKAIDSGA